MASSYKPRNYLLGGRLLELRNRSGLTQVALAQLVGVSKRSVLKWEGGEGAPGGGHLGKLVAVFAARGAFTPGEEPAEAAALWEQVREAGTRRLGMFDEAWFTQQLTAAASAQEAPLPAAAVRDGSTSPTTSAGSGVVLGMPFQPTPLLGREAEIDRVAGLLDDPGCRMLTFLGPGGIGKTRLALAVASRLAQTFHDGAAVVDLTSTGTTEQMVAAMGSALGLSFIGQPDPFAHLLAHLRERQLLLVLDNFEHLLSRADIVNAVLHHAPRVTVLVTSQVRLNLQAEWLFDVDGLAYPTSDSEGPAGVRLPNDLLGYSAVQLFVERASQVQPRLSFTDEALEIVGRICQQVAGMPLAIEISAASTRSLSLTAIERQIRANVDELTTTLRDVPARHRSLRAVFDHSWELLDEPERALFSRLAVFRGSWTAAAAGEVADATPASLTLLVDHSLVRALDVPPHTDEPASTRRFTMLEPLREYAFERLAARSEADLLRRSHAAYYLTLAELVAAQTESRAVQAAHEQIEREHDNLRAALQWARDQREGSLGIRLAAAVWRFWRHRGYLGEGRRWLAEILASDEHAGDGIPQPAQTLPGKAAAWLASDEHDFTTVVRLLQTGIAQQRTLGEAVGLPSVLLNGARQARGAGEYGRAAELLEQSLSQHRDLVVQGRITAHDCGPVLQELAMVARERGDFSRATALWEECLELYQSVGDRESSAVALLGLSDIARDQGDAFGIIARCEASLALFREYQHLWGAGYALNNLALAAYLQGDLSQALARAEESIALFAGLQAGLSLSEVLITLGRIQQAQGYRELAKESLLQALHLAWNEGPRWLLAASMEALASAAGEGGGMESGVQLIAAATGMRERMGAPVRPMDRLGIEQALTAARVALGEERYAALWSEAQAMSLEQLAAMIARDTAFGQRTKSEG